MIIEEAIQAMRKQLYINSTTSTDRAIAEMELQTKKNNDKKLIRAYNKAVRGRRGFDYNDTI